MTQKAIRIMKQRDKDLYNTILLSLYLQKFDYLIAHQKLFWILDGNYSNSD